VRGGLSGRADRGPGTKGRMMHILVTGGAGFIGSHTVDALLAQGHTVRILDNLQKPVHARGKPDHVSSAAEFRLGDVREKSAWVRALQDVEAVYHLAAYQDYLTDFSTFFHVNAVSTALLYEVLVEQGKTDGRGVRKVIVSTSQAVMGEGRYRCARCFPRHGHYRYPGIRSEGQLAAGKWEHPCPECGEPLEWVASDESVAYPGNQYALSKHSQEQVALALGKRYGIPTVVLRYSIVQGPRQSFHNAYSGAMRIFALSLFHNRSPMIFEDGGQVRDFVNIEDVVSANLLVLENPDADFQVFNVGGGKPHTVLGFYDTMQRLVGKAMPPDVGMYYRYGDTRHIFSDITRLGGLGWRPRFDIERSIAQYWGYLQGRKDLADTVSDAYNTMQKMQVIRRTH